MEKEIDENIIEIEGKKYKFIEAEKSICCRSCDLRKDEKCHLLHRMCISNNRKDKKEGYFKIVEETTMEKDALKKQVGGEHYKEMNVQPIELIASLDLNFFQGNIVKYLSRRKGDDDITDWQKALHYCELAIKLDRKRNQLIETAIKDEIRAYAESNDLGFTKDFIIKSICLKKYRKTSKFMMGVIGMKRNK